MLGSSFHHVKEAKQLREMNTCLQAFRCRVLTLLLVTAQGKSNGLQRDCLSEPLLQEKATYR